MRFKECEKILVFPNIQCPIIYFLLDKEEVVYVGQSKFGVSRPFMHRDKDFTDVAVMECKENELDYYETKYIRQYNPKYNRKAGALELTFKKARNRIRETTVFSDFTVNDIKRIMKKIKIQAKELDGLKYIDEDDFAKIIEFVKNTMKEDESLYFWRNRVFK